MDILQTRSGIPSAGRGAFEARFQEFLVKGLAGSEGAGDRERRQSLADKKCTFTPIKVFYDTRCAVAKPLINSLSPEIRRFAHMSVSIHNRKRTHNVPPASRDC